MPVGKLSTRPCAPGERTSKEEERVTAKRQRLVDLVRLWLPGPRKLVITYQDIEKDFQAWPRPRIGTHSRAATSGRTSTAWW